MYSSSISVSGRNNSVTFTLLAETVNRLSPIRTLRDASISETLGRWFQMGVFSITGLLWMLLGYNVMAEDRPQTAMA